MVSANTLYKRKNSLLITQIADNQYLIEGDIKSARFGYVVDPIINFVDISNGPYIQLGMDFFGKGSVDSIDLINKETNSLIIKVTINI